MILRRLPVPFAVGILALAACVKPVDSDVKTPSEASLPGDAVIGIANIDDDDENGESDWDDSGPEGENDRVVVDLSGFGEVQLTLAGDLDLLRVWQDGAIVLDADRTEHTIPSGTIEVEFGDFLATGTLVATPTDQPEAAATLTLSSAPLILNHHLQGAELVVAMSATGRSGNVAFVEGFQSVLGDAFTPFNLNDYGMDVWVEDELEFATLTAPGHRMDVVIDSIRTNNNRYLDNVPEDELEGPDTAIRTWGSGRATSQDSFGNLEVSPPVTVDGVEYPFGRIYWGDNRGQGVTDDLAVMLEAQRVQDPFQVDNTWLCVGHVDEFSTFVPDPTAPKGFRFLYADTELGRAFLEGLDPSLSLPQYRADHGYATIGDMLEDDSLWSQNEDMQADYLDPNLAIFKAELGLDDEDIILVPGVFYEEQECGGGALALIPATVNLVVADMGSGPELFLPDPFLRTDVADQSTDPFIAEVASLLPSSLSLNWLDDWDWYHMAWGEVHCGSNTRRTPIRDWWTDAKHLLEGE
ncbi:MAG: protein-arginine deiminase family protein [Pseudomonadota bacterium]|nr:protein-arginine deiminase family protein [Pseudomonadota bacterium]